MVDTPHQYLRIQRHLIHVETGVINVEGEEKRLAHLPLQVLLLLARHHGETLTKQQILDVVWRNKVVGEEVLTVAISQIRKALGDQSGSIIKTISGKGYRFIASDFAFESERQASPTMNKIPLVAIAVFIVAFCLVLILTIDRYDNGYVNKGYTALSEQQRQQLQKSRFLITVNSPDARQESLAILTPMLMQYPGHSEILTPYIQLKIQMAYANEVSWKELATQLIPLINTALENNVDDHLNLYLAELEFKGNWDFTAAREAFERALSSESDNGLASFSYAQFLLAEGDFARALSLTRDYIDKSPEAYSKPIVVWVYNMMRQQELAIAELASLEQYNHDSPEYWVSAQITYENAEQPELAWQYFKKILRQNAYSHEELMELDEQFQQSGLKGVYRWLLQVKKEENNIGQYRPPISWARYAAKSGDEEAALNYIEQALQLRQYEVLWLGVDPGYQSLHQNPKFNQLLQTYGIPFPNNISP